MILKPSSTTRDTPASKSQRVAVEFMPGRVAEVAAMTVDGVPKYVMCKLVKQLNGTYALVPESWPQMVRMTRTLHEELGLQCSYRTLYQLVRAGFVRGSAMTPWCFMVDLASFAEHMTRCEVKDGEPSFWTKDRKERYRLARAADDEEEGA